MLSVHGQTLCHTLWPATHSALDVSPSRLEKRRELLNTGAGVCFGELRFQYSPEIFDWIEVRCDPWSCALIPEALYVLLASL